MLGSLPSTRYLLIASRKGPNTCPHVHQTRLVAVEGTRLGGPSPGCIDDDDIPLLANFQRSVCVRLPQRVSCIDGGSGQGLGHGHSHVHTGQVHDHRLRQEEKALEEQPLQVRMLLHSTSKDD